MTRTLVAVPASGHLTGIQVCDSSLFGKSFQPECLCSWVGGHYSNRLKAATSAREHLARHERGRP